ncbi:hypothetical protein [Microbacterium sp. NPDC056234]|uniref:phage tail protein n=1 Tax=Microbacterium sp. NPDC056234 TaxID=3345757 RepID=UPI0035D73433
MFGGTSREAVEALSSALKGERDPIERYGVSLKQASIDAKAAELGFTKVGGALSAEANAAATLALIMEQTADAHGNFAKESTTYEGVMQRLGASWANVSTTIGQAFLPFATAAGSILLAMMPTIQGVADNFAVFGERMSTAFQDASGGLAGVGAMFADALDGIGAWASTIDFGALVAKLVEVAKTLGARALDALPGLATAYLDVYPTLVELVWGGLYTGILDSFLITATALIGFLPLSVPQFASVLVTALPVLLAAGVELFMSLVTGIATVLPTLLTTFTDVFAQVLAIVIETLPQLLASGIELFTTLVQAILDVLPVILDTLLGDVLPNVLKTVLGMLPELLTAGIELFMELVNAILDVLPDILDTLLGDVLPNVLKTVLGMLPELLAAGIELFFSLVTAILDVLPDILKTLLTDVLPNVLDTIRGMLPELLTTAIDLFFTLVEAILTVLPDIISTLLRDVLPTLITTLINMVPRLINGAIQLFGALVQGLVSRVPAIARAILTDIVPALVSAAIDSVSSLLEAGKDVLRGLIDGLWSMASSVADALISLIGGAVDGFLGFLGINSPSRLLQGIGLDVGESLADDLDATPLPPWYPTSPIESDGYARSVATALADSVPARRRHTTITRNATQGLTAEQEIARAWRDLRFSNL